MNVSVCITTFNESEERVKKLLDVLNNQTVKPNEIIIIERLKKCPNFSECAIVMRC